MDDPIETQFLVVGAGPAGISLACFLTMYGLKGLVIASSPGTSDTPRAHITNAAAIECFRDLGIEKELVKAANAGSSIMHVRWCASLAGEEFGRVYAWGNGPDRKEDFDNASPCKHCDLPQAVLEPILVRHAAHHGFPTRFSTTLLHFLEEQDTAGVTKIVATVRDELSKHEYRIRTKYLFGADGGRSAVAAQLGLPMVVNPGGTMMMNILVKADLSHLMEFRQGNMHWIMQPDRTQVDDFGSVTVARMVKTWDEWVFSLAHTAQDPKLTHLDWDAYVPRIKESIGDDTPVEVLHVSKFYINETYAETYSKGNVFCLGDAVHRHPPSRGLGSNTCIQDAYNLAWKIAYVEAGQASPKLLDTYSVERQPVGADVVLTTNQTLRNNFPLWADLGLAPPAPLGVTPPAPAPLAELASRSDAAGDARRQALRDHMATVAGEFNGLGTEMGQLYGRGGAVYLDDENAAFQPGEESDQHYAGSTYPGRRLPHAWLNTAVPRSAISTIDLAGHGAFVLLTGRHGEVWKDAAAAVGAALKVPINAYSIGYRQDWEDVYFRWDKIREVDESGAILVRPDRFVAWRAKRVLDGGLSACEEKLATVMKAVLGSN
ncbi:FAD binding domain-containing protein [Lasiosphaeria miniovina]|uniref:FAD binding domain-containing protein n=1 Tax=Lasiosphaeria miniovina TaxID=1954250 RepID=A0AA40AWK4_9PEZI|nr:FAD binding domain-containing protein [Lasiosphaeria miniovina]KAK0723271.1 FAD binding domain-containing protein [Lasiosphaeria miniovina]